MKRKITLTIALAASILGFSQTPAGNCIENINVPSYINCGNNAAFNLSGSFTLEAWINQYTFGADRKLMGKTNNSFNSGFVFGLEDGIYAEIWQPARTELKAGTLPTFTSWVHIALTFSPGNTMKGYINGQEVGSANVASGNLATNTEDFIIGIAPWDFGALMFLGQIDEVRIWAKERTEAEIHSTLHTPLTGSESDLLAYYSLSSSSGSTAINSSTISGLDGSVTGSSWVESMAVLASSEMQGLNDVQAMWLAMTNDPVGDLRVANTTNGLSIVTEIDTTQYLMFGHDGGTSTSTDDLPSPATDASYSRLGRTWLIEPEIVHIDSAFVSQLIFDLSDAADGGTELSSTESKEKYALFRRSESSGEFTAVAEASTVNNGKVIFDNVELEKGYYTMGLGNSSLFGSTATEDDLSNLISIYPNPSNGNFVIKSEKNFSNAKITIVDIYGKQVLSTNLGNKTINVELNQKGVYFINIETERGSKVEKVIVK